MGCPTNTYYTLFSWLHTYEGINALGNIGESGNFTFICTPGPENCVTINGTLPCLNSQRSEVEIKPCDPGEELNGRQVCTRCVEGRYSPIGAKCFDCPVGGECKVSAKKLGLSTSDSL